MTTNKHFIFILSLLCLVISIENACVWLGESDAALFLEDLAVGNEDSRLKKRTPTPKWSPINYENLGTDYQADLYQPGETPLAGIVLIPGVAQHGRDDTRLVAFANTLARNRFIVLVPDIPNLRDFKVQAEDSRTIAAAFLYLIARPEFPAQRQVGIAAMSYAVGPAILAALEPKIRERANFVFSVGGYYDVEQVVTFFTTGYFQNKSEWQFLEPNEYGKWVFVLSNVDHLKDPMDKDNFFKIAQRKMNNPNAVIDDLVTDLTLEANSILRLLENKDPELVSKLIDNLPSSIRNELDALNISNKDLTQLKAQLILLHGTDDNIIPYTESIALANAAINNEAELFLIDGLAHVNVHPKKLNRLAALRAIKALLKFRDVKLEKL